MVPGYGAPREIRTPDQLVRSQLLYPAELWAQTEEYSQVIITGHRSIKLFSLIVYSRQISPIHDAGLCDLLRLDFR